jgi:hypothetical protein
MNEAARQSPITSDNIAIRTAHEQDVELRLRNRYQREVYGYGRVLIIGQGF